MHEWHDPCPVDGIPAPIRRLELLSLAVDYATRGKPGLLELAHSLAGSEERLYFVRCYLAARRAYRAANATRALERLTPKGEQR